MINGTYDININEGVDYNVDLIVVDNAVMPVNLDEYNYKFTLMIYRTKEKVDLSDCLIITPDINGTFNLILSGNDNRFISLLKGKYEIKLQHKETLEVFDFMNGNLTVAKSIVQF